MLGFVRTSRFGVMILSSLSTTLGLLFAIGFTLCVFVWWLGLDSDGGDDGF